MSMATNSTEPQSRNKVSELYKNVISEVLYSSDSDCEYELLQTIIKIKSEKETEHNCEICKKKFVKSASLRRHLCKHANPSDSKASEIPRTPSISNLNRSENVKYVETKATNVGQVTDEFPVFGADDISSDNLLEGSPETANGNDEPVKKPSFSCSDCNKKFKYARNLINHQKYHLKQSADLKRLRSKIDNGFMRLTKLRHSCQHCHKSYSEKLHLDNHMTIHKNDDSGAKIDQGESSLPTDSNTYLCTYCGKKFNKSSHLSAHVRVHINEKPHLCSVCGKSFSLKRYLIVHQRCHTQEKPFSCDQCNKSFNHKGSLTEHLRIHSGIKPYTCNICLKKFTHYSGLTQHLKTHVNFKKYSCNICDKSFRYSGHYQEHIRRHTGDRPYSCSICTKAFVLKSTLTVHLRTHTGERPYQCTVCKKSFIKGYGLTQHLKTHSACNVKEQNKDNS